MRYEPNLTLFAHYLKFNVSHYCAETRFIVIHSRLPYLFAAQRCVVCMFSTSAAELLVKDGLLTKKPEKLAKLAI